MIGIIIVGTIMLIILAVVGFFIYKKVVAPKNPADYARKNGYSECKAASCSLDTTPSCTNDFGAEWKDQGVCKTVIPQAACGGGCFAAWQNTKLCCKK